MMSQTELLSWTEPDTKFFADNLLGVEDWGESITELKFDPDDFIQSSKDDEQMDTKADDLTEFLTNLGDSWSPLDSSLFGGEIKEEPLSPSDSSVSSISLYSSLPSSPESENLKNGQSSPTHQSSAVTVDLPIITQPLIKTDAKQPVKTETALRPACSIKQERVPIQPCNVRQIKPSPPTTITVQTISLPTSAAQTQTKLITSPRTLMTTTNGVTYVPCTNSVPLAANTMIVENKVSCQTSKPAPLGSVTTTQTEAEQKILKRQQRMIKNRESACLSRRKKKEYLQTLENKLKETAALNEKMKHENEILRKRVQELENENQLLRSRSPELASTVKKTTCVLAVVLFIALNIGPFSNLQEQWKLNRPVLPNSLIPHHGRALLQYENTDAEVSSKPPPPNVLQKDTEKSFLKLDIDMLNMSQEKNVQTFSRKPERTDLMVVSKNIWDPWSSRIYSKKMKAQKNRLERRLKKKYSSKTIQRVQTKQNLTTETICFNPMNKTEAFRINGVLEGITKQHEVNRKLKQRILLQNQAKLRSSTKKFSPRPRPNLVSSAKNKARQPVALHKYRPQSVSNALQLFREKDVYESFQSAINRKMDTFYIVSFRRDHLMFPATQHNETQRPKMSLMLLAPSNESSWKTAREQGFVPMMQIDCQVMDTKLVKVNKSSIPYPYADTSFSFNPSPLVSSTQYASQQPRK